MDPRNRVALSKDVMRALDVQAGDYVTFDVDEAGTVRILKLAITALPPRRAAGPGRPP